MMAKIQMKMPEDFLLKLSRLEEQTDIIIPKVLEEGGQVVLAKVKSNLSSVIGKNIAEESRSLESWNKLLVFPQPNKSVMVLVGILKWVFQNLGPMADPMLKLQIF